MAKVVRKAESKPEETKVSGYDVLLPFSHRGKHYQKGDIATGLSKQAVKLYKNAGFIQ